MTSALTYPNAPRVTWKRKVGTGGLVIALSLFVALFALSRPKADFIEYWAASHLLLKGSNPYSLPAMFVTQKALGWPEAVPLMFVCPPWVLPLISPLGLASSYVIAWIIWMAVIFVSIAFSSKLLMDLYFEDVRIPEISDRWIYRALFTFSFYPALLCLKFAQTGGFLLLGLAGFLYFIKRNKPVLSGLALSLIAIKPQLLFLVWIALLLQSIREKRWKVLLSAASALAVLTGLALVLDRHAFHQYRDLASTPYLSINPSGITAMIRRAFKERDTYWMQFVPPFFGAAWLFYYWRRNRDHWNWAERMPAVVTASVLTTAYGWVFDQTVLAVAVIALAAKYSRPIGRIPWNVIVWYTGLNGMIMLFLAVPPLTFIPAPVLFAAVLARRSETRSKGPDASAFATG